jgi:hypothetical protein
VTVPGGGKRLQPGVLWLLLASAVCCAGPLLAAGLAAAGALAWGGLGLALAILVVGALTVIRRRRVRSACECGQNDGDERHASARCSHG